MSDTPSAAQDSTGAGPEEMLSAVFAQMVLQLANLAMMLLGKVPHPQSGQAVRDLEGARMLIDQLEMIEAKTKGNLSKEEQSLLRQSLMSLRLAFVEAVESPAPVQPGPTGAVQNDPAGGLEGKPALDAAAEADGRKKFSKKY